MWKKELIMNKIAALVLIFAGVVGIWLEQDGTLMLAAVVPSIMLFCSKENAFGDLNDDEEDEQ